MNDGFSENPRAEKQRLPEGWRWVQLKEIGSLTDGDWILNTDYAPVGVRLLQVGDVGIGQFVGKSSRFVTAERAKKLKCTFLEVGDILISRMPDPIGRACQLPALGHLCITAVDVSIWRPDVNKADREYLVHYLNSPAWFERVRGFASGATRPRISRSNLEKLEIPLPPLAEQKRIAAILKEQLAAVARARVAAEARLEAAEALRAGYVRLVLDGPVAKAWPKAKFGMFVRSYRNGFGRRPVGTETGPVVLRLADVSDGVVSLANTRRVNMTNQELATYFVSKGDLLFVRVNGSPDFIGRCIHVNFEARDLVFNDHLIRVQITDAIDPAYVRIVASSSGVRSQILRSASTSAGQLTINQTVLGELEMPVPSVAEQQRVVACHNEWCKETEHLRSAIQEESDNICALPSALLCEAFNGEL